MKCPNCDQPLESDAVGGQAFDRCGRCGGEYFSHHVLHELLSAHAPPTGAREPGYQRPSPLIDPVRYRKCPSCGEAMLRQNFRESSGVVVDVCAADGIWLDRGELATLIEFASTGAMAEAERRIAGRAQARRRLDAFGDDLRAVGPRHYIGRSHGVMIPVDAFAALGRVPGVDPAED